MSKWSLELLFLKLEMLNSDLILFNLVTDIYQFLSVHSNQLQVFTSDVVVVLFHLSEGVFVVFHKLIDMLILSFFNLVNFNFHSKFEFFLKRFHLSFVVAYQLKSLHVEKLFQLLIGLVEFFLLIFDFTLVSGFLSNIGLLLLLLLSKHVSITFTVVDVLFTHDFLGVDGDFITVSLMTVL